MRQDIPATPSRVGSVESPLVITAVTVEKRPVAEVVADYGVSRSWVYELLARYRDEGAAAFEPRSRRPHTTPRATPPAVVALVLGIRKQLTDAGLDAGADTIDWHLTHHHQTTLSRATINRILVRAGTVTPDPSKRPKASYLRFEASQPNECWQSDFTHYRLTRPDGTAGVDVEVITWLDDHSRYALHISVHPRVTALIVRDTFRQACHQHGYPASTLTDNGRVALEIELDLLGVRFHHSRPYHPQTCGKVERFHQTQKKWLAAQPEPVTLADLQRQLDWFRRYYNTVRPHRAVNRPTPQQACQARPKATPAKPSIPVHYRVRRDKTDAIGVVTLRHDSQLRHIGLGREHARKRILMLVADRYARVVDAETGELLRELTIDPGKDYQPLGRPPGPPKGQPPKKP